MAAGNFFNTWQMATELLAKEVAVSYTTKNGDGQVFDSCVKVVDPASTATITVSDGKFMGQMFVTYFESDANSQDVVVTYNGATSATLTVAGCYEILMWIGDEAAGDWVSIKEKLT
jgi:hypothetical protein